MRRRPRLSNLQAGVIAAIVVAVAVFFGFTKGIPGLHHYTVNAVFGSADNLLVGSSIHPGSPVRTAGVNVGQVSSVRRGPGDTALVGMRIDSAGRPVHTDATAQIRPRLFLGGNFFVDLSPGSPSAPRIRDGGTIPLSQTARPVALYQVLDTFDTSARSDLQELLREYAHVLDKGGARALNRTFGPARGALARLAVQNQALRGLRADDLSAFVAASARTARALASRRTQLADLVSAFDATATTLAARRAPLAHALRGLDRLLADAPGELRAVDGATGPLARFARTAGPPLRAAPPVLKGTIPFLDAVNRLVAPDAIPPLLDDLDPTLRSLAALEPRLDELFGLVAPVSSCVTTHVLPVLDATVPDGALSDGQKVWEEVLHVTTGLASATQDFDGNGFATRYSFGLGQDLVSIPPLTGDAQGTLALGAIQGSRPAKPAHAPPFVAGVPCATQTVPDLHAQTHQATERGAGSITASAAGALLRLLGGGA